MIDKLITNEGLNVISGQPGAGKSWVVLEMAKAVASGQKLFDHYKTMQGSVMILDGESGQREIQKRMRLLRTDTQLPIFIVAKEGLKLDEESHLNQLLEEVKRKEIKLLIIDPLSAMHSRIENNAEDMQKVMEAMERFNKIGITVIFIHHHRKESKQYSSSGSQNLRGSSIILSRVDSQSTISTSLNTEAYIMAIFSQEKLRNGKKEKPFEIFIEEDEIGVHVKRGDSQSDVKTKLERAMDTILELLATQGLLKSELIESMKDLDIQERTTSQALTNLFERKLIIKERHGKENYYKLEQKLDV